MNMSISEKIQAVLAKKIPSKWDGKQCIEFLKEHDYNWKQLEWIGWYFEFAAFNALTTSLGGEKGPAYGSVVFDYAQDGVWDFKSHPTNQTAKWAYMNDVDAIENCIRDHRHLGWVIATGDAVYDTTGEFKSWHDTLKGAQSAYVRDRIARGARSRKRKAAFSLKHIHIIEFRSLADLKKGRDEGWLKNTMQAGQRNADGSARNAKYGLNLSRYLELHAAS